MGIVLSSSVVAVGTGYHAGDQIAVNQTGNHTATINILTVDGSGIPLTYALPDTFMSHTASPPQPTHGGCGYHTQNNVPTLGGFGVGFILNILTVGPGSDINHGPIVSIDVSGNPAGWTLYDTGFIKQGGIIVGTFRAVGINTGALISIQIGSSDGCADGAVTLVAGGIQPGGSGTAIVGPGGFTTCSATPLSGFTIYSASLI